MKIELHKKKIDEADEIQNGNGDSNASQDVNVRDDQSQERNTETSEINTQINMWTSRKSQLKTQYSADLKPINDQITLLQKQKSDLESDVPQNDEQAAAQRSKMININKQIIELVNRKLVRKTTYQNDVRNAEQNLVSLYRQQADNGGYVDPKCVDESAKAKYRFSRKLYEAVINRTEEMYGIISMAFDEIEGLSYRPEATKCKTYAKNIISFLNRFESTGDDGMLFSDFVYSMLNNSHVSLSNTEKEKFVENLINAMKENPMFSWVFKNENQQ